ncbi:MAG: lipase maturation factor family protein [Verrucomicrobia bacterium]|nr:lipase maturation factor family protein [Verrucomicrobiota bacterium]
MNFSLGFWFLARLTGLSYFFAFLSLFPQIPGLYGSDGILPAQNLLTRASDVLGSTSAFWALPSLTWIFGASNNALQLLALAGLLFSALFTLGLFRPLSAALAWLCWLSFVTIGQDFLSFQWDTLLLETGFLVIFLEKPGLLPRHPATDTPPVLLRLAAWFLIFRLMLSSGLVKLLSGDPTWADLSAMSYHFFTQPIPNPLSWFVHQLPGSSLATLVTLIVELVVPFAILIPHARARLVAGISFLSLMLLVALTGNYAYFNLLTAALSLTLIENCYWPRRLRPEKIPLPWTPIPWRHLCSLAAILQLSVAFPVLLATAGLTPRMALPLLGSVERIFAPWHLTSGYGLFAVMTVRRPELVLEHSRNGTDWQPLLFRYKAGPPDRLPPQIAPFQPRLDWQMWFAALSAERGQLPGWFAEFVKKLRAGSPAVTGLLAAGQSKLSPDSYLRIRLDQYRFTTPAERSATGHWWHITPGPVLLVLSPEDNR